MFLRNFLKLVEPAELLSPTGVVTLFLQGLARGLYVPFWSSVERFLAPSPLFLLALASSGLTGILHVLRFESLTPEVSLVCPSPPSRFVVAKTLDLLCSSV